MHTLGQDVSLVYAASMKLVRDRARCHAVSELIYPSLLGSVFTTSGSVSSSSPRAYLIIRKMNELQLIWKMIHFTNMTARGINMKSDRANETVNDALLFLFRDHRHSIFSLTGQRGV
jgi:hypothetical protein